MKKSRKKRLRRIAETIVDRLRRRQQGEQRMESREIDVGIEEIRFEKEQKRHQQTGSCGMCGEFFCRRWFHRFGFR